MTKNEKISRKNEIYEFIVQYTREHLYPPSVREICAGVNLKSTCSVFRYLSDLEEAGMIELGKNSQSRAIKILGYRLEKDVQR